MKKILFPTDFSEHSHSAYAYTLNIASKLGADISTLHCYHLSISGQVGPSDTLETVREQEALEQLENYREAAAKMHERAVSSDLSHVSVDHLLEEGLAVDKIVEISDREDFDLILMGTKGATGLKEIIIGSNTARVIEDAKRPVLSIPEYASFGGVNNIAYATNFDVLDREKLEELIVFADKFDAKIHVIHVNTDADKQPDEVSMDNLKAGIKNGQDLVFEIIEHNDLEEGLNKYIEAKNIDILAMLTHRHNFFQRLFGTSEVQKMAFHGKVPLLTFHETDE